jgi:hypothetical protein
VAWEPNHHYLFVVVWEHENCGGLQIMVAPHTLSVAPATTTNKKGGGTAQITSHPKFGGSTLQIVVG